VLVLSDEPAKALPWKFALEARGPFQCEVGDPRRPDFVKDFDTDTLRAKYQAICLIDVAHPDAALWDKLRDYVDKGGGLAVIPGGEELGKAAYNDNKKARDLLPGRLEDIVTRKPGEGVRWLWVFGHPVLKPFQEWMADPRCDFRQHPPSTTRYWKVTPY